MDAFIGQICVFPFGFAPRGWLPCDGRLLSINQNTALFSLLGTTFGGDGMNTFGLPNMMGNVAVGATDQGGSTNGLSSIQLGETGGNAQVTLLMNNLPPHTHTLPAQSTDGTSNQPGGVPAKLTDSLGFGVQAYGPPAGAMLDARALAPAGSSMPISVQNPSLGTAYFICMSGIFPPRS